MKNCGSSVHNEVATKEFMEFMKQLVTVSNILDMKLTRLFNIQSNLY